MDGRVLGTHGGVSRYTVGQRRGLNVSLPEPLFVVGIDAPNKRIIVGPREALMTHALTMKETNWLGDQASIEAAAEAGLPVLARVRSTREPTPARLAMRDGAVGLIFDSPEEGVAPGQACVLYDAANPSRVLGGGFIAATQRAAIPPRT
jgi:tRNA-specific 2-thiouridylase